MVSSHEKGCPWDWGIHGFFIEDPSKAVIPSALGLQGTFRVHRVLEVNTHP
jgi:hypothetical protein